MYEVCNTAVKPLAGIRTRDPELLTKPRSGIGSGNELLGTEGGGIKNTFPFSSNGGGSNYPEIQTLVGLVRPPKRSGGGGGCRQIPRRAERSDVTTTRTDAVSLWQPAVTCPTKANMPVPVDISSSSSGSSGGGNGSTAAVSG